MSRDFATDYAPARERLLTVLSDLRWHSNKELTDVGGARFGARLLELKRLGYAIEAEELPEHGRQYRLTSLELGAPQIKRVKALLCEADVEDLLRGRMTLTAQAALKDALGSFRANKAKL